MGAYNIVCSAEESTVVAEYRPERRGRPRGCQSEADLERSLVETLLAQGYRRAAVRREEDLAGNLRKRLEELNRIEFTDGEWERLFKERLASSNEGPAEKTRRIQEDHVQSLVLDDGTTRNILLMDKRNIHNNILEVASQLAAGSGARPCRYDVTILVNGLPLVHIELKKRGIPLREAFNQIARYQRDSFWSGSGLFQYVQIFVISNGTSTRYYSGSARAGRANRAGGGFRFAACWADAANRPIPDLEDFARTFLAKRTILSVLARWCVLTSDGALLVMRPYQIAAVERILGRIEVSTNYGWTGTPKAGGYVWHTTGSGKTLTSFKAARLAASLPYIDKVLFVVDRRDLDYQTIREYDRFEKGAADGNRSAAVLQRQLEDRDRGGAPHAYKIIVTTIQKLDVFVSRNKTHPVYGRHVVMIFDECHRSQFGAMRRKIAARFRNCHIFGFTGTPIFAGNAAAPGAGGLRTTEQAFGDRLHTYTIVDAINDGNVLPFRIDYVSAAGRRVAEDGGAETVETEEALGSAERVGKVAGYILDHFDRKTVRGPRRGRAGGFGSIFATESIALCGKYYLELRRRIAEDGRDLRVAMIYSSRPNGEEPDGLLGDESFDTDSLDRTARGLLEEAVGDYNRMFRTSFDISARGFQDYYKDLSMRVRDRQVDLLLVVDMFLTGFDAAAVNTLWVDKNLRMHGLLQAFSRTNRILDSVKTFGNIVCFRNLEKATEEAMALFGDKEAGGVALLRGYRDYYDGYTDARGRRQEGYRELVGALLRKYPPGERITGERNKRDFIALFGKILRVRNILSAFDRFEGEEIVGGMDFQDYTGLYCDLHDERRGGQEEDGDIGDGDGVVFEVELVRQVEVDIDYILALVERCRAARGGEVLAEIGRAVRSSPGLRPKRALIESFAETAAAGGPADWRAFVAARLEADLAALIARERLRARPARAFVARALDAGSMSLAGMDLDLLLPPASRFGGAGGVPPRDAARRRACAGLSALFERYRGLLPRGAVRLEPPA